MKYKVKFNLFDYDINHNPINMKIKTIWISSDKYDNIMNKVISLYPGALYIVIYPFCSQITKIRKIMKYGKSAKTTKSTKLIHLGTPRSHGNS